jgi:hypothetical protein
MSGREPEPALFDVAAGASARRIRSIAAAVLFSSGVVIGCTAGRLSVWFLLPTHANHLAPARVTQLTENAKENEAAAASRGPEIPVVAPPEKAPSPSVGGPPSGQSEGNAHLQPGSQASATAPPPVVLLNPGAVEKGATIDQSTKRSHARTADGPSAQDTPRSRRDHRVASDPEDDAPKPRPPETGRNYRSLREEMLRR